MSSASPTASKSPLGAAQKIVDELAGMSPEHQTLALRFAVETLGLKAGAAQHLVAPPASAASTGESQLQGNAGPSVRTEHSTDIKSFTAIKQPKSDRQFTAVVAYFYQFEAKPDERKDTIDQQVMKDAARLAGWPQVARWSMTLTNAKNAGYLDAAGNGKFKLSSVGENLVAITLPESGLSAVGKPPTKKAKASASKKAAKKKR